MTQPIIEIAGTRMSAAAAAAFRAYHAMGADRSLSKLAAASKQTDRPYTLRMLRKWAHKYGWSRIIGRITEQELAAERAAVLDETAKLARKRLQQATELQADGELIIDKAEIETLTPEQARKLIGAAITMVARGWEMERLELGLASERRAARPPKPVKDMTDDEFAAWRQHLDHLAGVA